MFVPPFNRTAYADMSLAVIDGPDAHPASAVTPGVAGPAVAPAVPRAIVAGIAALVAAAAGLAFISVVVLPHWRRAPTR